MIAGYIRNRVTSHGMSYMTTPYELVFGRKPNSGHIRVFERQCWFTKRSDSNFKLDERATDAILIG